jgi:hypothetical protein
VNARTAGRRRHQRGRDRAARDERAAFAADPDQRHHVGTRTSAASEANSMERSSFANCNERLAGRDGGASEADLEGGSRCRTEAWRARREGLCTSRRTSRTTT